MFSEKYGYVNRQIQIESMDTKLRNRIWTTFYKYAYYPYDLIDFRLTDIEQMMSEMGIPYVIERMRKDREPNVNGNARRYMLSSKVYAMSGNETGYSRQRGMTTLEETGMIERYISTFGKISRGEAAELCKCDSNHAYYLLKKMTNEGKICPVKKGIFTYYEFKFRSDE